MSLKEAIATARIKQTKGTTKMNSTLYNQRKNQYIHNLVNHPNPIVRAAAISDPMCPTGNVNDAALTEQDPTVLRAILMSPNLSIKSLEALCETDIIEQFDDDEEIENHLRVRLNLDAPSDDDEEDNL